MNESLRERLLANPPVKNASQNILTPQQMMHRIVDGLDLTSQDVSSMFSVTMPAARKLIDGQWAEVKTEDAVRIYETYDAYRLMQNYFKIQSIPDIIRRNANLFNGETALHWIKKGKIVDVALDYVGTGDVLLDVQNVRNKSEIEQRYPSI